MTHEQLEALRYDKFEEWCEAREITYPSFPETWDGHWSEFLMDTLPLAVAIPDDIAEKRGTPKASFEPPTEETK